MSFVSVCRSIKFPPQAPITNELAKFVHIEIDICRSHRMLVSSDALKPVDHVLVSRIVPKPRNVHSNNGDAEK